MACCASGINIPQIALKKLLSQEMEWSNNFETKRVSQFLQPIAID